MACKRIKVLWYSKASWTASSVLAEINPTLWVIVVCVGGYTKDRLRDKSVNIGRTVQHGRWKGKTIRYWYLAGQARVRTQKYALNAMFSCTHCLGTSKEGHVCVYLW